jgi:outer membrane protein OmpA-like peptidoglycan-associated protein
MKKILGLAALAAILVAAPAYAQRGNGGGGHGGGFHGGGHVGGGFHGGGYRGGFRGGYGGYRRGGGGFYLGFPSYYPPYYGPMYSPYYYGAPYPPVYAPNYSYTEDLDDNSDRDDSAWRVTRRDGETDFELPDSVLFALDSATISPDADAVLKEIADAAKAQPRARLVVEGHTDTSGTKEHNKELSDARSRAVATVLARSGVERDRITTEGLGESQLAVQTGDEVREPRNRRVVVRLIEAGRTVSRIAAPQAERQAEPEAEDAPPPRSGNRP